MKKLPMTERSRIYAEALIKGLHSCAGCSCTYSLQIKWVDKSDRPKLLVKAKIKELLRIISDNLPEGEEIAASESVGNKYIERIRTVLLILSEKARILDDLRFNARAQKEWFFLLNLWHPSDLDSNIYQFNLLWNKVKGNNTENYIFHSPYFLQSILDAIPLPIFYKDSVVYIKDVIRLLSHF